MSGLGGLSEVLLRDLYQSIYGPLPVLTQEVARALPFPFNAVRQVDASLALSLDRGRGFLAQLALQVLPGPLGFPRAALLCVDPLTFYMEAEAGLDYCLAEAVDHYVQGKPRFFYKFYHPEWTFLSPPRRGWEYWCPSPTG